MRPSCLTRCCLSRISIRPGTRFFEREWVAGLCARLDNALSKLSLRGRGGAAPRVQRLSRGRTEDAGAAYHQRTEGQHRAAAATGADGAARAPPTLSPAATHRPAPAWFPVLLRRGASVFAFPVRILSDAMDGCPTSAGGRPRTLRRAVGPGTPLSRCAPERQADNGAVNRHHTIAVSRQRVRNDCRGCLRSIAFGRHQLAHV